MSDVRSTHLRDARSDRRHGIVSALQNSRHCSGAAGRRPSGIRFAGKASFLKIAPEKNLRGKGERAGFAWTDG